MNSVSYKVVEEKEGLREIAKADINCVIWQRDVPEWVKQLPKAVFPAVDICISPDRELDFIKPRLSRYVGSQSTLYLTEDIKALLKIYSELTKCRQARIRFLSLDKPMCPGFHTDTLVLRMICTYIGTGTEWLPDEHVDRRYLGNYQQLEDQENPLILDVSQIKRMPLYAVGLLKGSRYGSDTLGVVHRSPTWSSVPYYRLVVSIDGRE
ncbi:MAG: DUF1826 domain-containing protein [Acidobacteriota bacterium]|nr:DUF1826 domain-containing protein [Blastocatellia bacterium]MDW8411512.1 DUF1826 domain-containing protein [Acidobacteriota bacterium]